MQSDQIVIPARVLDDTLEFIGMASHVIKRGADELEGHHAQQKRAAALQAPLVQYMAANGLIKAGQEEACAAMLGAHDTTIQLCKAAMEKYVALRAQAAGGPARTDLGAADPAPAPPADGAGPAHLYIGSKTAADRASDRALAKIMDEPGR